MASSSSWPPSQIGQPNGFLTPRGQSCASISYLLGRASPGQLTFDGSTSALPDVSGLALNGVGTLPLPLCREIAVKIVSSALVEQENVWMLFPHLINTKNPSWGAGIQSLAELSSHQLGYKDVVLKPYLSKLMVVGPGGKIDKQQDTDIGNSVATLVVVLPSEYTGGDWVVYDEAMSASFRYDMGKQDGTAAFKPHYAVYAADLYFSVEEVRSGYCVVMIYSLYLPDKCSARHVSRVALRKGLAQVIGKLKGGPDDADGGLTDVAKDEILALSLSKSLTQHDIETSGVKALHALDRVRFELLLEANKLLPPSKQLVFYLARLNFGVGPERKQTVNWYSRQGQKMDHHFARLLEWAGTFNFLNPDNATLRELGPSHFALVGWPRSADIANTVNLFGEVAAGPSIMNHVFISITTLESLLEIGRSGDKQHASKQLVQATSTFVEEARVAKYFDLHGLCRKLVTAVINSGNVKLVDPFFNKYVALLKDRERTLFIPYLSALVQTFGWGDVQASVLRAIDVKSTEARLDRALLLADALHDNCAARLAIVVFAEKKSRFWNLSQISAFAASGKLLSLLRHMLACGDFQVLTSFSSVLEKVNGNFLGSVVDLLSQRVGKTSLPECSATLAFLATKRREWLLAEIKASEKPFLWSIPDNNFPDSVPISTFLRGPDATFKIGGFSSISEARARAEVLRRNIKGQVEIVAGGRGRDAFVHISKAGGQFDPRRKEVMKYEEEIKRIAQLMREMLPQDENTPSTGNVGKSTVGKKRPRELKDDAIVFE